jgi:hypothetical protein
MNINPCRMNKLKDIQFNKSLMDRNSNQERIQSYFYSTGFVDNEQNNFLNRNTLSPSVHNIDIKKISTIKQTPTKVHKSPKYITPFQRAESSRIRIRKELKEKQVKNKAINVRLSLNASQVDGNLNESSIKSKSKTNLESKSPLRNSCPSAIPSFKSKTVVQNNSLKSILTGAQNSHYYLNSSQHLNLNNNINNSMFSQTKTSDFKSTNLSNFISPICSPLQKYKTNQFRLNQNLNKSLLSNISKAGNNSSIMYPNITNRENENNVEELRITKIKLENMKKLKHSILEIAYKD